MGKVDMENDGEVCKKMNLQNQVTGKGLYTHNEYGNGMSTEKLLGTVAHEGQQTPVMPVASGSQGNKKMKVRVNIDVMNFQIRAFLVPPDARPLTEFSLTAGIMQLLEGKTPTYLAEKGLPLGHVDLYPYLSKRDQERIGKIVDRTGGLGMSGWYGSIIVNISSKKLQQALQEKEAEK